MANYFSIGFYKTFEDFFFQLFLQFLKGQLKIEGLSMELVVLRHWFLLQFIDGL